MHMDRAPSGTQLCLGVVSCTRILNVVMLRVCRVVYDRERGVCVGSVQRQGEAETRRIRVGVGRSEVTHQRDEESESSSSRDYRVEHDMTSACHEHGTWISLHENHGCLAAKLEAFDSLACM